MKPHIDILPAQIGDFQWLQVTAIRNRGAVSTATVFWLAQEGKAPELCNLFVQESARRQSIAQAIIQAIRKHMDRPLCLHAARESPAYWLYRKLGFLEIGTVKEIDGDVWMMDYGK